MTPEMGKVELRPAEIVEGSKNKMKSAFYLETEDAQTPADSGVFLPACLCLKGSFVFQFVQLEI